MLNKNSFILTINADEAFENLKKLFDFAEACGQPLSNEQKEYCEEWLFDCVHDTGYCKFNLPLEIFNASFDAFKEEN